jgi:erythrocyte band 7 integral membrane protein
LQVLTKDSVTVSVDAVVYYRVNNATVSVANVENAHHSTRLLAQTTLRNMLGTKALHEILGDRESISNDMQVRHKTCDTSKLAIHPNYFITLNYIFREFMYLLKE